jgi:hypothetical protein
MAFALVRGEDAMLSWDGGVVDGYPPELVADAEAALQSLDTPVGATPTGPWFAEDSPEAAFITLAELLPSAEVLGDPPRFAAQEDELADPGS